MKAEMSSKEDEKGEEFIPNFRPALTTLIVDDIEIKYEEMDFQHNNSTPPTDFATESDIETVSSIPHSIDFISMKVEEKNLKEFYLDLLQCEENCETYQKYMRILSKHVRTIHAPTQPIQDPLLIDPLHVDPDPPLYHLSSSVQIKCEVDEAINKTEFSEVEEKSMPNSQLECEPGPNYSLKGLGSENEFKCNECGKRLITKNDLTNQMSTHTGERPYKCGACGKSFLLLSDLTQHKRVHTGEGVYKCDQCEKCFSLKSSLTRHKRSHNGWRPYQCDECEKSFMNSSALARHRFIHTGERPFKCEECEKTFIQIYHLTEHKRTHTGERPYKCNECEKTFMNSSTLAGHKRFHTGERPYKCDECEKSFSQRYHFTEHKRTHTGERPYKNVSTVR